MTSNTLSGTAATASLIENSPALLPDQTHFAEPAASGVVAHPNQLQNAPEAQHQAGSSDTQTGLTIEERELLNECEISIEKNRKSFEELLEALYTIYSLRLYRNQFSSFENYCHSKWGFGRSHAYRLLAAREIVLGLKEAEAPLPANEAQARLLANLSAEDAASVMEAAQAEAGRGPIRTKDIKAAKRNAAKKDGGGGHAEAQPEKLQASAAELAGKLNVISSLLHSIHAKLNEYELPQDIIDELKKLKEEVGQLHKTPALQAHCQTSQPNFQDSLMMQSAA